VRACLEKLRLKDVAGGAYILHCRHTGRSGTMVSVTSRAGRRTQIAPNNERLVVNALAISGELVGRDLVRLHVGLVGMTAGAGLGDVRGVDTGTGVAGRTQVVHTMAIDADGNLGVALSQEFAMNAGLILAELIGAQR